MHYGLIVATNTAPVSSSVRSPAFAGDSMGSTDVSGFPFTVVAKGTIPSPGIAVMVGTQPPPVMPSALQRTTKPCRKML